MIVDKKETGFIEIDLTGPDGNVFYLLGVGKKLARQIELNWDEIRDDMMSGDYEHAVDVFEEHFGNLVILYR